MWDIKIRVTNDLVHEFQSELAEKRNQMKISQGAQKQMEEQVEQLQAKAEKTKDEIEQCQRGQKSVADQLAMAEVTLNDLKATSTKETTEWKAEIDALGKQLAERSSICDFLKEETELTRYENYAKRKTLVNNKIQRPRNKKRLMHRYPKQEETNAVAFKIG
ncbi:uncharacterized protein FYW49_011669 [Xenentodon cancila]